MKIAPIPLTPKELDIIFQSIVIDALQLERDGESEFKAVRVGWQVDGQPGWDIGEDVAFVRVSETDDAYNRVREFAHSVSGDDTTLDDRRQTYTRCWRVFFTLYGPNCTDCARRIRSYLFTEKAHDVLEQSVLYLIPDNAAPHRVPELFQGRWWDRADFEIDFYEGVTEFDQVGIIGSIEFVIKKQE